MRIGETITSVADLASLPRGSEIEQARVLTKCADGWYDLTRPSMAANAYTLIGWRVRYVGIWHEWPTVEQFKQRFATLAIGMAKAYSEAHVKAGRRMLLDLDCDPHPPLRLGMWVHVLDHRLIQSLPAGALLRHGPDEEWYYNGAELQPMQPRHRRYACLELVSVPADVQTYAWSSPRYDEGERLDNFKRAVWTVGWNYKQAGNGDGEWCAAYEAILARVGLDASLVGEQPDPGTTAALATGDGEFVDEQAQRELPVGAVIRWTSGSGRRSRLKVRSADADNDCGTRTLYVEDGNRFSRNAVQNQVVYLPGEDMSIPVFSTEELSKMPEGTEMQRVHNHGVWRKGADDWWIYRRGAAITQRSDEFRDVTNLRYVHIPGVN